MQFTVVTRRTTGGFQEDEIARAVAAEVKAARDLYQEGFIRQIWHRGDEPGAVLLIEAACLETLQAKLMELPMAKAGMLEAEKIIPIVPYRGFASN